MSELLAESEYKSEINAPIEAIDLTNWVFTLADDEYQRCSKAHVAAGASTDPTGKRVSINVEKVGNLIISHYNEDVSEKDHCRVVSISDVFTPQGRTKLHITWELKVTTSGNGHCEFLNRVAVHATPEFHKFLVDNKVDVRQAQAVMVNDLEAHNTEETPLFAKSIERMAHRG
jgi:hypothetical protein